MFPKQAGNSQILAFSIAFLLFVSFAGLLWAQSNTGRIVGTVFDAAGAVVPGAKVLITDNQTKRERTFTSDEAGSFTVPLLDVGSYTVKVTKEGFKTYTANDVKIEIGREYPLQAVLEVGSLDVTVEVTGGATQINTTSGEVTTTVNSKQVLELPLNGRNPLNLLLLQAGTSSNSAQGTSINGQRTGFTNITRDGLNIQDAFIRSNATDFAPGRPTVDDTEEFTISTQNAGAEAGYGGAQVRLVTPRGSSNYHGALWEFNRNSAYAANDFFNNKSKTARPFRNRNQFGGKIGGPVPGLKDKLYFFGFYEGLRDTVTSIYTRTLLLPDARNGIFSYVDNSGTRRQANLLSLIPSVNAIDPIIKTRMLDPMPTSGNRSDIGDQYNTTGMQLNQPANTTRNTYTARLDFDASIRHSFNFIISRNDENNLRPDVNSTESFLVSHPVDQQSTNTQITGSHRWVPGATFYNEIRGGTFYSEVPFNRKNPLPDYYIIPGVFSNPELTFMDQGRSVKTYNIQDNADKIIGRHDLRFGGMVQMFQVNPNNYAGIVSTWNAGTNPNTPSLTSSLFPGGISSTQLGTANALFSTLGGIISSGSQAFNVESKDSGFKAVPRLEDYRYSNYGFYLNDQWRVTPRLTLNLGLRYEILTPARLLNGLGLEVVIPEGADPIKTVLDPNGSYNYIGGNAGNNRLFKTDWNNFAPVVSFAYSPQWEGGFLKAIFGKDGVIRGGYRDSFVNDQNLTAARNAMLGNVGLSTTTISALNPVTGTSQLNARLSSLPSITAPQVVVPRTFAQNNGAAFSNFGTAFAVDPNLKTTRVQQYNLSIQRPMGWGMVWEVRYAGGRSNNLWRVIDYNQIDIRDNGFADDFNRARRNLVANGNPAVGETLTVFPNLASGGLLNNSTVRTNLINGVPADLALIYIQNQLAGSVKFLPNLGTGVADVLSPAGWYQYNAFQTELNKRFSNGFYFQANYTWQKTLTDAIGTSQQLVDTIMDLRQPNLEKSRADYDTAQLFNFNSVYDLPFGRGKALGANVPGWVNHIIGGWQMAGIWRWTSGTPITIVDPRGTLNRAGRSARQTPNIMVDLTTLKNLTGLFENSKGIYFLNPAIVNPATGRAAEGYATTPFSGQIFWNVAPGQTGYMGRAVFDGPSYFNIDASLLKNFRITESASLQLRFEAFNFLNHTNFYLGQIQSINSTTFGRMTANWGPRVVQFGGRLNF